MSVACIVETRSLVGPLGTVVARLDNAPLCLRRNDSLNPARLLAFTLSSTTVVPLLEVFAV